MNRQAPALERPRFELGRVALTVAAPAPAALLTLWGVLIIVLLTDPIRPYTDGLWLAGDLLELAVLGAIIGLVSRPMAAGVGIPLGMAAAVALQLYALAGQAEYQPVVVTALTERTWIQAVSGAILTGLSAIGIGWVLACGMVTVAHRTRRDHSGFNIERSTDWTKSRAPVGVALVALLGSVAVAVLVVGWSVVATGRSAYLPTEEQPTVHVVAREGKFISVEPTTLPTGRARLIAQDPENNDIDVSIVGPLSADELATLEQGQIQARTGHVYLPGAWEGPRRRFDLPALGTYAFVIDLANWSPPPDFDFEIVLIPISDSRTFTVTATDPAPRPSTEAGGEGGRYLTLPVLAALGVGGWAATGSVLARSRQRRPTGRRAIVALIVGFVSTVGLGLLALLAVNQAHSPF